MDMSIRFPGLKLVLDYVPKSFEIFGFEITIYGVLIAVGMLLGIFFVVLEARRNHEDPDGYLDLTIITLIAGVIGARLLYAAFSWSLYKNDPGQILKHNPAAADVGVTHLTVAHLAGGQPHVQTAGREFRVGALGKELIEHGRLRQRDGVARAGLCQAEAVHNNQRRRCFVHNNPRFCRTGHSPDWRR